MDYITITTGNVLQDAGGTGMDGTLYASLPQPITLAGGDVIPAFRKAYTVTTGAVAGLSLPITEDASPAGVSILLEFLNSQGIRTWESLIVTPRSDGPIALELILPAGGIDP